jgi:hypothetical protein
MRREREEKAEEKRRLQLQLAAVHGELSTLESQLQSGHHESWFDCICIVVALPCALALIGTVLGSLLGQTNLLEFPRWTLWGIPAVGWLWLKYKNEESDHARNTVRQVELKNLISELEKQLITKGSGAE